MSTTLDLAALGITTEDLQNRVVERMATMLLKGVAFDEDSEEWETDSALGRKLQASVQAKIDETINALAEKHILPNVAEYIETLVLQRTNQWGEKQGKPTTFVEYLTKRADAYMREDVNYEGKTKEEGSSYSWNKTTTRVAHMIDKHLYHSIETAMKNALASANGTIKGGLEGAIKTALANITSNLTVSIKTEAK